MTRFLPQLYYSQKKLGGIHTTKPKGKIDSSKLAKGSPDFWKINAELSNATPKTLIFHHHFVKQFTGLARKNVEKLLKELHQEGFEIFYLDKGRIKNLYKSYDLSDYPIQEILGYQQLVEIFLAQNPSLRSDQVQVLDYHLCESLIKERDLEKHQIYASHLLDTRNFRKFIQCQKKEYPDLEVIHDMITENTSEYNKVIAFCREEKVPITEKNHILQISSRNFQKVLNDYPELGEKLKVKELIIDSWEETFFESLSRRIDFCYIEKITVNDFQAYQSFIKFPTTNLKEIVIGSLDISNSPQFTQTPNNPLTSLTLHGMLLTTNDPEVLKQYGVNMAPGGNATIANNVALPYRALANLKNLEFFQNRVSFDNIGELENFILHVTPEFRKS
ncbi:MAG UNVERIFIED_CONTAM: hypothetical protein LVQ98_05820 [Rickettsiaceae bacterium]|jgi:hypothetical protein